MVAFVRLQASRVDVATEVGSSAGVQYRYSTQFAGNPNSESEMTTDD